MLTIAIPTFNRNHLLKQCLLRVLPQLLEGDQLLIVDNASTVPVQETIGSWLIAEGAENVRIVRNVVNIGGGANILRCLELCETKWLYCLGDDDLVAADCIEKIRSTLSANSEALYVTFNRRSLGRKETVISNGLSDFVETLDSWSDFLFMSTCVVDAFKLRSECRYGYLYSYSWAPVQAILLRVLDQKGGFVVFSSEYICVEESLAGEMWAPFPVVAGKMVLPELISDKSTRTRFARKLQATPSIISLIYLAAMNSSIATRDQNSHFVTLYIDRCLAYQRRPILYFGRVISYIFLRLLSPPNRFVITVLSLARRAIGKTGAKTRRLSEDRT